MLFLDILEFFWKNKNVLILKYFIVIKLKIYWIIYQCKIWKSFIELILITWVEYLNYFLIYSRVLLDQFSYFKSEFCIQNNLISHVLKLNMNSILSNKPVFDFIISSPQYQPLIFSLHKQYKVILNRKPQYITVQILMIALKRNTINLCAKQLLSPDLVHYQRTNNLPRISYHIHH